MTLQEYLNTVPSDVMITVGGKADQYDRNVSSWAFIGSKAELLHDIEELDKVQADSCTERAKRLRQALGRQISDVKDAWSRKAILETSSKLEAASLTAKRLIRAKKLEKEFKSLMDLNIAEHYPETSKRYCSPYRDGIHIILDYPVVGGYWFKEEYDKREKEKEEAV